MCEKGLLCADCPTLLDCEVSQGLPGSRYREAQGVQDGSLADTLLTDALTAEGLTALEAFGAAPKMCQAAGRRLVFDGANPVDVVIVFVQAFKAGQEKAQADLQSTRTGTEEAPYTVPAEPIETCTRPCWNDFTPHRQRLLVSNKGTLFYDMNDGLALVFDSGRTDWLRSALPDRSQLHVAGDIVFITMEPGLSMALRFFLS